MKLSEVFQGLGRERFEELVRGVSMGKLKTYQVYDSLKVHGRLNKLNRERLRKAVPQLWARLQEGDDDLAKELAQGILVSNLPVVVEVLDFLEIPHDGSGFFDKSHSIEENLKDGWQESVYKQFKGKHSEAIILLYINHLAWEVDDSAQLFLG